MRRISGDGDDFDRFDGYDDGGDDDDFDGGYYENGGDTRISVVDQRGRPVAVSIQGNNVQDMWPPYEDRSIYANTRRRSRF